MTADKVSACQVPDIKAATGEDELRSETNLWLSVKLKITSTKPDTGDVIAFIPVN